MILSERHIIKNSKLFNELDNMCFLSKNLYNKGLYIVRQHFFNTEKYLNYNTLENILKKSKDVDYYALPTKVSQQILMVLDNNFKSFFKLLEKKKKGLYKEKVKIPKYLDKDSRNLLIFTSQAISKKFIKNGIIKLSNVKHVVKTKVKVVKQVRIIHKGRHVVVEVLYEKSSKDIVTNNRYAAIDLGLNNLATISSNVTKPFIVNGKPLKSINQYYNKTKSNLQSKLKNNEKSNKRISSLNLKRNNKINDYLHKSSTFIVNYLVSNNISTLIVGHNKEWKQNIKIGKKNNQNFVSIPHSRFKELLKYKCELEGIKYIETEESYTSKCSFLDNEEICKHTSYKGKRIKRGLFKSNDGTLINADVNGSLNILKKVVGNFNYDPIEVCSTPSVYTVKFN